MDIVVENYCNSHVMLFKSKTDGKQQRLVALNAFMRDSIFEYKAELFNCGNVGYFY